MDEDGITDNGDGTYSDEFGNVFDDSGNLIAMGDGSGDTGQSSDSQSSDGSSDGSGDGSADLLWSDGTTYTDPTTGTVFQDDGTIIFADGSKMDADGTMVFADGSSLSGPDANGDSTFTDSSGVVWTSMASAGASNLWQADDGTVWNSSTGETTYPIGVTPNYTDPSTLTKNADGSYTANTGTAKPPSSSGGGGGTGFNLGSGSGSSSGSSSSLNDLTKALSALISAQQAVSNASVANNPLALAQAQANLARAAQLTALNQTGSLSSLFSGNTGILLIAAGAAALLLATR